MYLILLEFPYVLFLFLFRDQEITVLFPIILLTIIVSLFNVTHVGTTKNFTVDFTHQARRLKEFLELTVFLHVENM